VYYLRQVTGRIDDPKAASALSLDLASKIVTVLDCGIEDLMEAIDEKLLNRQ